MKSRAGVLACLLLAACASAPTGPSVMVLPGTGRTFDDFRADEATCRRYAYEQTGGVSAQQRERESTITGAAVGTVAGAAVGAAVGGHQGAAVGAGTGLIVGGATGMESGQQRAFGTQQQYDSAFIQCMYAKGHRVPVPAGMAASNTTPNTAIPPPPKGSPPPAPRDAQKP